VTCSRDLARIINRSEPKQENSMNLTRIIFLALAVVLPASWTVAHAEEGAPAAGEAKKEKKAKKAKKADAPAEGAKEEPKK
jgi:hypothetical protein